jgi:DNA-binding transcriptional LysR family regulator
MELRTLRYFVALAEELHFGRAAARLHMTQPPLSRAIKALEAELGCVLLERSPSGVALTPAGAVLHAEARTLLAQADRARDRVVAAAGTPTFTLGTLADSVERLGARLVAAYRRHHPTARVSIREGDLSDPTIGLRAGLVDVALTRTPFDDNGISTRVLRTDPIGVLLRTDDPLADKEELSPDDLAGRSCFRFPDGTDPVWRDFWTGLPTGGRAPDGPVVRTVHECIQSVLWNGTVGVTLLTHPLPEGLTAVPLRDAPSSRLVIAWAGAKPAPPIRSFVGIATELCRAGRVRE